MVVLEVAAVHAAQITVNDSDPKRVDPVRNNVHQSMGSRGCDI